MSTATVLAFLQHQTEPVTALQAARDPAITGNAKQVGALLADMASGGQVFAFTQGKTTAYAAKQPLDMCADALAAIISGQSDALAPAKLKGLVPKSLRPWFDEALGRLIVQGKAHWLPKGASKLIIGRSVRGSDVLTPAQVAAIKNVLTEANRRRRTPRTWEQFAAWLDADEVAPAPAAAPTTVVAPKPEPKPAALKIGVPTKELLLNWYRDDLVHSSSTMIAIPNTWARYDSWADEHELATDVETFRRALAEMYEAGQIILEPCERPNDLPDARRRLQVPLTIGPPGYYWKPMHD